MSITVTPVNDAPVAAEASLTAETGVPSPLVLSGSDPDGDTLTYVIVTPPAHGTLSGTPPLVTYTSDAGFVGDDSFAFVVDDGQVQSAAVVVPITVVAVNSVPVAVGQVVETLEDTSVGVVLSGTDADVSDVLSFAVVSAPLHGSLSGTVPALVYTPDVDFHGSDSFSFTVDDGVDVSVPGLVAITVTSVNDAPTVVTPVVLAGVEGSVVPIVATVGDVDGDVVSVVWSVTAGVGVDAGAGCSIGDVASTGIVCSDDGVFTVTATVSDGVATAVAQTELTVANADPSVVLSGVPPGPVRVGDVTGVVASITDAGTNDTQSCRVDWGDGTVGDGSVVAGGAGVSSCTADHIFDLVGDHTVVITATDDDGGTGTATVVVTVVAVAPVNHPPTANPTMVSATSGVPEPVTLSGSDPDGDPLDFVVVTPPAHGRLTGTGAALVYTSDAGYVGADSFAFEASDGEFHSPAVTVPITVAPAPSGLRLSLATDPGRSANVRPLDGAVVTGGQSAYVFVGPDELANVRRVTFLLDGLPFGIDTRAPYDFAGTTHRRPCRSCAFDANPFESNLLSLGSHRITAVVTFRDRTQTTLTAAFTVADTTPHGLLVSSSADRTAAGPLDGATLSGRQYVFLGPADDPIAGLTTVVFLLDGRIVGIDGSAPYDLNGTRRGGTAPPLDTRRLRAGSHRITAIALLNGLATVVYTADFRVAN